MTIIHCCFSGFNDNYGYQENMLAKFHIMQGHNVIVITSVVGLNSEGQLIVFPSKSYNSSDGYKVVRINYKKPLFFNKFIRRHNNFFSILDSEKPDIIFVHGVQFYDTLTIVKYVKLHPETKIYVDNHADYFNSAQNWLSMNIQHGIIYRYYAKKIEPYVQQFYGVLPIRCEFLKDVYKLPEAKISCLEMGIDDSGLTSIDISTNRAFIRKQLNVAPDDFLIISGGKIDEKKNIHLLMQAVAEIQEPKIKLAVFGKIQSDFKKRIECLLNERIILIGWLSAQDINKYLMASDLAVMPGSHSVLWEQIVGCGVPAVFKHFQGMHHIDIGGNCRFLYKDSVDELKDIILEIYKTPSIYKRMKIAAADKTRKRFYYSEISKRAIED